MPAAGRRAFKRRRRRRRRRGQNSSLDRSSACAAAGRARPSFILRARSPRARLLALEADGRHAKCMLASARHEEQSARRGRNNWRKKMSYFTRSPAEPTKPRRPSPQGGWPALARIPLALSSLAALARVLASYRPAGWAAGRLAGRRMRRPIGECARPAPLRTCRPPAAPPLCQFGRGPQGGSWTRRRAWAPCRLADWIGRASALARPPLETATTR